MLVEMTVIARDAVASDHLVYAWPFPLGPECEVSCGDDEQVVMCPSWLVGDRLGPGRHLWRTPDPMRPVAAFFVRMTPVETVFDLTTSFVVPATGQPVRLRAVGTLAVRCADPGLLIAQFVGLPFDHVNDGILRSVSRSVERMLARLLTRRVVLAASPYAVTDPAMLGGIVEELIAYNPTAGAVFGIELLHMGHLMVAADDGLAPYVALPGMEESGHGMQMPSSDSTPPPTRGSEPNVPREEIPLLDTARGRPRPNDSAPPPVPRRLASQSEHDHPSSPGDLGPRRHRATEPGMFIADTPRRSGIEARASAIGTNPPGRSREEITEPGVKSPYGVPAGDGARLSPAPERVRIPTPIMGMPSIEPPPILGTPRAASKPDYPKPEYSKPEYEDAPISILGIGVGHIGTRTVSGEIPLKVAPGQRVLVPGPNGLMQSATVRQLLQGYYELEVGSSGETIWVPVGGVVPE